MNNELGLEFLKVSRAQFCIQFADNKTAPPAQLSLMNLISCLLKARFNLFFFVYCWLLVFLITLSPLSLPIKFGK